ncbi:MAG: LysM peptidoglycan-binding domain-containing protein [Defluviitaleaceae bacterium]|nr:LysM peptidoglycan-binding domain-containing protein [Defluviitaleaceae bacterium]
MKDFDDKDKKNLGSVSDHESVESFSRRAVESLFAEESSEDKPATAPPAAEEFKLPTEAPYRERLKKDPEMEYASYINSAREANRKEHEVGEVKKEASKRHIDAQWEEISKISGGKKKEPAPPPAMPEKDWGDPAHKARPPKQESVAAARKPMPPINIRNVAMLGVCFVLLLAFVVAMWQAASLNSRLTYAEDQVAYLQEREIYLQTYSQQLRAEIDGLEAAQTTPPPMDNNNDGSSFALGPPVDSTYQPATSQPPAQNVTNWANTHRDGAGNLVYTVQRGEGLWGISTRFFGSGGHVNTIMQANNMTTDQVQEGQEIIIPGL